MTTVFFGGSRKLSRLNTELRDRIRNLTEKNFTVLVGDANGADKAVQAFLAKEGYRNVEVFCMEGNCRNNLGSWPVVSLSPDRHKKGFAYFAFKDAEMSRRADYGFMIWDGKSKGTLNNVLNLLEQNKSVLLYFSPKREFVTLKSRKEIERVVERCDPESRRLFERTLGFTKRTASHQGGFNLA